MICAKCSKERGEDFYNNDRTCKECRKASARKNRQDNIERCRQYDRDRAMLPHRVKARKDYQKTPEGLRSSNKAKIEWTRRNAIKRYASTIVGNAVRDGKLKKPNICENCKNEHQRIHGHHDDYAFPLSVRWLCPGCHSKWHKENGEGLNGG